MLHSMPLLSCRKRAEDCFSDRGNQFVKLLMNCVIKDDALINLCYIIALICFIVNLFVMVRLLNFEFPTLFQSGYNFQIR